MRTLRQNQKGFTLVELLAVIVILGVIAAIAVPAIGNVIEKSKVDSRNQSLQLIRDAAELYLLETDAPAAGFNVAYLKEKGFLRDVPNDPVTNGSMGTWEIHHSNGIVDQIGDYYFDINGEVTMTDPTP